MGLRAFMPTLARLNLCELELRLELGEKARHSRRIHFASCESYISQQMFHIYLNLNI